MFLIVDVEKNSIADSIGIEKGQYLGKVNSKEIIDVFDYRYELADEYIEIEIVDDNESIIYEIEKDFNEDIGLIFETDLMDTEKACCNKCVFCFIDQLPKNMRKTMYFKDDDVRLSFLTGNYVTLTNVDEDMFNRIIKYHLSPLNISIHATDDEARIRIMKNPNAKGIIDKIKRLLTNRIEVNAQIVLVKGYNDKDILEKSFSDLLSLENTVNSLSVVPVGLTRHRDKLERLDVFKKEDCIKVIGIVEKYQTKFLKKFGRRVIYASDEFYIKAEMDIPNEDYYEGYPQIENGVGLARSFINEFNIALKENEENEINREITMVTGNSFYTILKNLVSKLDNHDKIKVVALKNRFFGETVTVAGLMTGIDLVNQLKNNIKGNDLFLPSSMFKPGEDITLDGYTKNDLEKELRCKISIIPCDGYNLVKKIFERY